MKIKYNFALFLLIASVLGAVVGYLVSESVGVIEPLGKIFTRLLFMLVPGLVFFSIASSFANILDMRTLGKWGGKIVGWFLLTTVIATILGVIVGLIWKPGTGLVIEDSDYEVTELTVDTFIEWIPDNAFGALASGDIIQIVIFSIITGLAAVLMKPGKSKDFLINILNTGQDLFLTITKYVMYYAPIGIFALMANSVASLKDSLLTEMASFLTAYTVAFVLQIIIAYILLFWFMTKLNPFKFIKKTSPALLTAFGTVSSAGTLPVTLRTTKELGVNEKLSNFGIPLGVTFNMDSMALEIPLYVMLGMYATGYDPTLFELFQFVFLGIVLSIGTAGVPGGGIAIATILVSAFGLPVDVVAWIAAVFVYLDVTGTTMNVWGDMACTTIIAKREGELDVEKFNN